MSKKFTVPQKFERLRKTDSNINELMEWYEDKLSVVERRVETLSNKLTDIHKKYKEAFWDSIKPIADEKAVADTDDLFDVESDTFGEDE